MLELEGDTVKGNSKTAVTAVLAAVIVEILRNYLGIVKNNGHTVGWENTWSVPPER